MKSCFLMDIDGTLADVGHRLHFIQEKPKNWDAFFDACSDDPPFEHMQRVISGLALVGYIVYVSGRPERNREATNTWLRKHGFHMALEEPHLYMRADGDFREDQIIKKELLDKIRLDGWNPIMVWDDRSRVVNMWRENNIPCAQVAEGNF